jgi:hypothetical protein
MHLEGDIVGSIILGNIFALILTIGFYFGINFTFQSEKSEKWNRPIIVVLVYLVLTIITSLRYYYGWF